MGFHAKVMEHALNDVLKSEDNWCTGAHARSADGTPVGPAAPDAQSWCAEGAIMLGVMKVGGIASLDAYEPVLKGVAKVLNDQYPEFVKVYGKGCVNDLPAFNDGIQLTVADNDSEIGVKVVRLRSVGYEGIRAAFEKYLTICQEKDL